MPCAALKANNYTNKSYVIYSMFNLTCKAILLNSLHHQHVAEEALPLDVSCSLVADNSLADNSLAESGVSEDPTIQYNKNLIH